MWINEGRKYISNWHKIIAAFHHMSCLHVSSDSIVFGWQGETKVVSVDRHWVFDEKNRWPYLSLRVIGLVVSRWQRCGWPLVVSVGQRWSLLWRCPSWTSLMEAFSGPSPAKHICKVISRRNAILKQDQAKTAYNSLQHTNINVNLGQAHTHTFMNIHARKISRYLKIALMHIQCIFAT